MLHCVIYLVNYLVAWGLPLRTLQVEASSSFCARPHSINNHLFLPGTRPSLDTTTRPKPSHNISEPTNPKVVSEKLENNLIYTALFCVTRKWEPYLTS